MSNLIICDICSDQIKKIESQHTCHKCSGIESQFNKWCEGKVQEYRESLTKDRLKWMVEHGANHLRSLGGEDAASPPRRDVDPPSDPSRDQPKKKKQLNGA